MKYEEKKYWRKKTPTLIQMEAAECGAASLGIILGYYRKFVSLEELRLECGVSRDGSSALKMRQAAEKYGMSVHGFQKNASALYEIGAPCVILWEYNHFLVLEGFSKKKVFLNDPNLGPRSVTYEEFERSYSGIVLTFTPTEYFKPEKKPPILIKEIHERLKSSKSPLLYLLLTSFFLILPGLAFPVFTRIFIDDFLITPHFSWEANFLAAIFFTMVMAGLLAMLRQHSFIQLNAKLSLTFSSSFLWHLLRLPIIFYTQRYSGEIAYRMNFNDTVAQTLTGPLANTILDLLFTFFYGFFLFLFDASIGAMAVAALVLNFIFMFFIQRSRSDAYARLRQEYARLIAAALGGIQQIEAIKATGSEGSFFSRKAGHLARTSNALQEIGKKDAFLVNSPLLFQALVVAGLFSLGGWRVVEGKLSIGMLMALYLLLLNFLQPVSRFVNFGQMIQNMNINLQRLDDVLKNPQDKRYQKKITRSLRKTKMEGFLQFQNVSFGYIPSNPPLIEDLSFDLTPGKRIALVGPSGCGKSTIARLASSLYSPWKGTILYDHQPFLQIDPKEFQNSIGYIDQEIILFEGTLWDNLTLWDSKVTEEMIFQATKDALLHEIILSQYDLGYKTPIIEGGKNLSGGQRQLLEIARALVKKPSILIMDEATSALDSQTERDLSDNIRRRGCSCLMIAHRLSTIQDSDEIIVLDKGRVKSRGTHKEMKEKEGLYRELVISERAF